jgi:predicted RNA-binding protein YlxR (DUF448 family)
MKAGKGSLLRLVRDQEGRVSLDPGGKAAGRGAYVCSAACLDALLKSRRLEHALRTKIAPSDYERIAREFADATPATGLIPGEAPLKALAAAREVQGR